MLKQLIATVMLAAGCGTTLQETQINPAPHAMAARSPASVEVFSSGPPARPHIDVALLEARQTSGFSGDDTGDFVAKLREQAAQRGCDGIVIGGVTNESVGEGRNQDNRKGLTATCIVYTTSATATASE
jgi:hypothetical protein